MRILINEVHGPGLHARPNHLILQHVHIIVVQPLRITFAQVCCLEGMHMCNLAEIWYDSIAIADLESVLATRYYSSLEAKA